MANYNVMGFGGVAFTYSNYDIARFYYSFCDITFDPVFDRIKNANNRIFYRFRGYRRIVEVDLYSVEDGAYINMQRLITILNASLSDNSGVTLSLNYAAANTTNLYFADMALDSDFNLKSLARLEGLQNVKLKFISLTLRDTIPNFANAGSSFWAVQTDDTVIDGKGNSIIWR